MKVILKKKIKGLGEKFDLVNVKRGYAMNFLFPKSLAYAATNGTEKQAAELKEKILVKKEEIMEKSKGIARELEGITIIIRAKTTNKNTLYGSVEEKDILEKIEKEKNIQLPKGSILLKEAIKQIGEYKIEIKLLDNIKAKITVIIEKE